MSVSFKCRVKHSQLLRPCSSKHSAWHLTPSLFWVCSTLAGGNLNCFLFCVSSLIALPLLSSGALPAPRIYHIQVPISWWLKGTPQATSVCVRVHVSPTCVYAFLPCLCSSLLSSILPADLASYASLDSPFCLLTQGDRCVLKYSAAAAVSWANPVAPLVCSLAHGDHLSVLFPVCSLKALVAHIFGLFS